ncbi:annulin [Daktulosphaira vitifoliae]|uniref:annulin n=1 Tax=Daktulosphaira vitifoliae TaxID=58002 RepID=UPI0021AAEA68|nr:annulin [Daktulosphaira vitifoliae]XP_050529083.1 annulin [Daktulosphaira vitifoliae]XP_050529084.1 annulin [Daktulosphaira vitifoliae]XP_050529085.1 annulin [Daktulosphaira vitifoliae]
MTDCFGLCALFDRYRPKTPRSENIGFMGRGISKPYEDDDNSSLGNEIMPASSRRSSTGPLVVDWIDYCLEENGTKHKTSKYACMRNEKFGLVVRRGQSFSLIVKFNRVYHIINDSISFVFTCEGVGKPNFGHGTLAVVPLLRKPTNDYNWSAYVLEVNEEELKVKIMPAIDCIVGKWYVDIDTKFKRDVSYNYSHRNPIYILFNPWNSSEDVYLKDDIQREEYVLNEDGLMWRGSYNRPKEVVWKYGQFDKDVLDCCLYLLLSVGKLSVSSCNDPVIVSRVLSAAVNAPDDMGAIQGNWTEDFSGGTPPIDWLGSAGILQKFYEKKKPVKYGQCWVFAGVLTTACRALGIPCRPITAYCAAHDTQSSLTVDYFVDEDGKVMEEMITDSIWNYHVWNEVWMSRPDLKLMTPGWQVVDATPQELSENIYRCGPANVDAIKAGEIRTPYDTNFVFSEVNADKVYWKYNGVSQPLKLLRTDQEAIGRLIFTKAAERWEPEDITQNYKHPEKSSDERNAMLNALKQSSSIFSRYYLNENFNDIKFDFELIDDIVIGENFRVAVSITNQGNKNYVVKVILRVESVDYTGKNGQLFSIIEDKKNVLHDRGSNVQVVQTVLTYFDYGKYVKNQNVFNISCLASVLDTDFEYFAQDDFRVRKPDINISFDPKPLLGKLSTVTASFINPLPVILKRGIFYFEGASLEKRLKIKLTRNVEPKEEAVVTFKVVPQTVGRNVLAAKFTSSELQDVDGFLVFMVKRD